MVWLSEEVTDKFVDGLAFLKYAIICLPLVVYYVVNFAMDLI